MLAFLHSSVRGLMAVLAAAIFFTVSVPFAKGQSTLYLTAADALNTSSFTNPLTGAASGFSVTGVGPGVAAVAGNNYVVAGAFAIRTPPDNVVHTFPGLSLTLSPTGALYSSQMTFKTAGTNGAGIETVNLILNSGFINMGTGNGTFDVATLAGTMSVTSSSALGADAAEVLQINSTVSGTGALQIGGGIVNGVLINQGQSQGLVSFAAANTNYSGIISVGSLVGTSSVPSSANAGLQGSNSGSTNVLQAFGTGQINLYSAVNSTAGTVNGYTGITSLTLLANGSGGSQTIVTGNGVTGNNLNVTNSATVNLNHFSGSNTGSVFQFNNLSIGGSAFNHVAFDAGEHQRIRIANRRHDLRHGAGRHHQFQLRAIELDQSRLHHQHVLKRRESYPRAGLDRVLYDAQRFAHYRQRRQCLEHRLQRRHLDARRLVEQLHRHDDDQQRHAKSRRCQLRARRQRDGLCGNFAVEPWREQPHLRRDHRVEHGRIDRGVHLDHRRRAEPEHRQQLQRQRGGPGQRHQRHQRRLVGRRLRHAVSDGHQRHVRAVYGFGGHERHFAYHVGLEHLCGQRQRTRRRRQFHERRHQRVLPDGSCGQQYDHRAEPLRGEVPEQRGPKLRAALPSASNVLNVGNLYVAVGKEGGGGGTASVISFNGQPGTLTLNGASGPGSRAEVEMGVYNVNGTGNSPTGLINLTGGTANLNIDTFSLGVGSAANINGQSPAGTFIFNAGTVNVNNLLLGATTVANSAGTGAGVFGTFTIGGGTLTVNNSFGLGFNQGGLTPPVGTFNLNGGVAVVACPIQSSGGTSTFNFGGGTLMAGASSTTFMQGLTGANVGNSGAFIVPGGNNITIAQALQPTGGTSTGGLTESGAGVLTLAGSSTFVGPTTINGAVNATFLANVNMPSPIGKGSASGSPADLVIDGGTLQYTGSVPASTNRLFTVGGSGAAALDASGNANGSMTIGSAGGAIAFANTTAPATLTLTGSGAGAAAGTLGAVVGDSNPGNFTTSLVKSGTGQWNLAAANTYTGPTNVNAGGLYVNGSLPSSGTVNVAAGAALGGTGSAGNAFVSPGGGIDVSANGSTTLTLTSLNFGGNGTISMPAFTNTGSVALLAGSLTAGGAAGSLQINFPNVPVPNGTYRLIGYGSIGGSGFSAFSVGQSGSLGARQTTALLNNPGEIDYQVNGQTPFWNGTQTDWKTTNAWTLQPSGVPTTFITGDNDNFTDSAGSGTIAVTISQGNVAPISVTINNNAASYSFGGAYGIIDGGSPTYLVKSGTGSLTIANTNGYSGGTTFSAGLVTLNSPMALGTGSLAVNGGTLNANFAQSVSAVTLGAAVLNANAIGALGSGPLTIGAPSGSGTLSANFAQAVSSVTLNAGLLNINDPSAIGGGLLTIAGGTLDNTSGTPVALTTNNSQSWNADIVFNGSNSLDTGTGTVALGASRVVTVLGNNLSVGGISGTGFSLTKAGSGTLTLTGANTYDSGTLVLAGLLQVTGGSNSLSTIGGITTSGGTLDLGGQGQSTVGLISFQGGSAQNGTLTEAGASAFDAQSGAVTAVLAGNVGLNKTTTGSVVLGGSNAYTGKTTVGAGVLQLAAPNGYLPPVSAITITGGTLDLGTQSQSTSGVITFQGGIVQNGTLTESNTANAFAAQSGTVTAVLAGGVSLNKTTTGSVLLVANNLYTGNTTVSAGLLQMAGTNVYAGTTTVSGGSLQLLATNALPATTSLVFSGSPTVDLAGTTSQTIAGLTATGASVIQNIGAGQSLSIVSGTAGAVVNLSSITNENNVSLTVAGSARSS